MCPRAQCTRNTNRARQTQLSCCRAQLGALLTKWEVDQLRRGCPECLESASWRGSTHRNSSGSTRLGTQCLNFRAFGSKDTTHTKPRTQGMGCATKDGNEVRPLSSLLDSTGRARNLLQVRRVRGQVLDELAVAPPE